MTVYDTVVMIKAEEETTQSLESSTVRIKSHHQIWANDRIELQSQKLIILNSVPSVRLWSRGTGRLVVTQTTVRNK